MTPQPVSPDETEALDAPASDGADFARPLLEQHLAELSRLAAIGMEIAESLRRHVASPPEPGAAPLDPAAVTLAFSRVSRAVRLTFALQSEVIDKLRGVGRIEDYEAEEARRAALAAVRAAAAAPQAAEDPRLRARKDDIAATLTGIIDEIHKDAEGGEAHERCIREATERLKEAEDLGDILSRPFEEVVEQICRDLGLSRAAIRSPSPWMGNAQRGGANGSRVGVAPCQEEAWSEKPHDAFPTQSPAHSPPAEPLPPPIPTVGFASAPQSPIQGDREAEARSSQRAETPYTPPPDPDALPGYPVGLPGELPPDRGRRRPAPLPPRNYTHGFD